jgi:hypothetical protein
LVKLVSKPKRIIITFTDVPSEEFISEMFKQGNINFDKIESSNMIYYAYFKDEASTRLAFDWVENYKTENVILVNLGYII